MTTDTPAPDLAVLVASGRELLARDEIGRPVAIHGSGCPDDLTVNLWDIHHALLMDSMSPDEANEIAWWLNNGPALLDAAEAEHTARLVAERGSRRWKGYARYASAKMYATLREMGTLMRDVRTAEQDRDAAIARAEAAERERDEASEQLCAHQTTEQYELGRLNGSDSAWFVAKKRVEEAEQDRDAARAALAQVREALEELSGAGWPDDLPIDGKTAYVVPLSVWERARAALTETPAQEAP